MKHQQLGWADKKFQTFFFFSFLSRNSTTSACYKQLNARLHHFLLNCDGRAWWVWLFFPRTDRPASSANNTHTQTQNRERKKSTQSSLPSSLLSIFFHHQEHQARDDDEENKTKPKKNQTPKHKRLHLHSEHTHNGPQLNGEMRRKRKTEMIHTSWSIND